MKVIRLWSSNKQKVIEGINVLFLFSPPINWNARHFDRNSIDRVARRHLCLMQCMILNLSVNRSSCTWLCNISQFSDQFFFSFSFTSFSMIFSGSANTFHIALANRYHLHVYPGNVPSCLWPWGSPKRTVYDMRQSVACQTQGSSIELKGRKDHLTYMSYDHRDLFKYDKRSTVKRNIFSKYYVVFNTKLVWQDIYLSIFLGRAKLFFFLLSLSLSLFLSVSLLLFIQMYRKIHHIFE